MAATSPRSLVIDAIAVVAGAIIGLLVADFGSWLFADSGFFALFASGRLLMALVTVALFAFFYHSMPTTPAALASFFTGVGLPTVLEGFAFDSILSWGTILLIYVLFAVVALLTYRFVRANGTVKSVAADMTAGSPPER